MNVLIIGSEGFIGKELSKACIARNWTVYRADILPLEGEENYQKINFQDQSYLTLFQEKDLSVCINASGAAHVQQSFQDPSWDFTLNTLNVQKILEAIRLFQPKVKLINLSSAAVYGNPKHLPITETAEKAPVSPYGWHKKMAEDLCREYHQVFGLSTQSVRIFSAYGPGLKKQLLWDIYQKILKAGNDPIEMFGTGEETRDFIYIKDLVQALLLAVEKAAFDGTPVNIASGIETTIEEVVSSFFEAYFGKKTGWHFNGKVKIGDPKNWRANIKTLESWGFQPTYQISKGVASYVEWLKKEVYE